MAQSPEKIKVRKFEGDFYFFQKGPGKDTVSRNNSDLFYMKISRAAHCNTRIEIENGQLTKEGNDSTFRLKYFPNLNYLHMFNDSVSNTRAFPQKKEIEKCKLYRVFINGSNSSPDPKKIVIRFINSDDDKVFLTNTFYFK